MDFITLLKKVFSKKDKIIVRRKKKKRRRRTRLIKGNKLRVKLGYYASDSGSSDYRILHKVMNGKIEKKIRISINGKNCQGEK